MNGFLSYLSVLLREFTSYILSDLTGEEICQQEDTEKFEIVGIIDKPTWQIIIKHKLRGFVLAMAKELDVKTPAQFEELMSIVKAFDSR
ncbi:hypothetical protein [Desulfobacter vibrioformis]|uniref:hypothetical protein n=1 Tax=Desulfobacter vibrioformis TaxID=34031 RepID=UPI00055819BE|nr:hypothetical protein [Desulfobacter vibrioformis]